jgi:hypothetical protein
MADHLQSTLDCFKPNNKWPSPTKPGLPNFVQGFILATQAGCLFLLPFFPPNPFLPAIPPPPPLFLGVMMGAIDQSGAMTTPFTNAVAFMLAQTFTLFSLTILALSPMVPPQGAIEGFLAAGLGQNGLPPDKLPKDCFAKTVIQIIHEQLPV